MQPETIFPKEFFARSYFATGYFHGLVDDPVEQSEVGGLRDYRRRKARNKDDDAVIMMMINEFIKVVHG